MKYQDKLKDPRWQKKRLGIFERDNWNCRLCANPEETLHVHHLYYIQGADPWDYPDSALMALCATCHEEAHEAKRVHIESVVIALSRRGTNTQLLVDIASALNDTGSDPGEAWKDYAPLNEPDMSALADIIRMALQLHDSGVYLDKLATKLSGWVQAPEEFDA